MVLYVTKRNGTRQLYDERKVVESIKRTTADIHTIERVIEGLRPILKDGVSTDQIYERIAQLLKKHDESYEYRFRLREALGKLIDGDRFEFEKFVQALFTEEGYHALWQPNKVQGLCIDHQVDVSLPDERILIECKHHRNEGRMTGLGDALETWARLEDIKEGWKHKVPGSVDMNDFWLVVNTKFSEHARRYAKCKNMTLIGWGNEGRSIDKMIEKTRCFPITILPISENEHNALSILSVVSTKQFENLYRINDPKLARVGSAKRLESLYQLCLKL